MQHKNKHFQTTITNNINQTTNLGNDFRMVDSSPVLGLVNALHVAAHVRLAVDPVALVAEDPFRLELLPLAVLQVPPVHVPAAVDAKDAHRFMRTKASFVVEALKTLPTQEL